MNTQQAENLRVLIRHMETQCERTLNMGVVSRCGSPACAIGEAAHIGLAGLGIAPGQMRIANLLLESKEIDLVGAVDAAFGLLAESGSWFASKQAHRLFCGSSDNAWKRNVVSPKEWAIEARKVLAERGYSMDATPATPDAFAAFMAKVQEPVCVEGPKREKTYAELIDAVRKSCGL